MSIDPRTQSLIEAFEKAIDPLKAEISKKSPALEELALKNAADAPNQDPWLTKEGKILHAVGHVFNVLIHCSTGNFKGIPQEIEGVLFRLDDSKISEDLRVIPLLEKIQEEVVKTSIAVHNLPKP